MDGPGCEPCLDPSSPIDRPQIHSPALGATVLPDALIGTGPIRLPHHVVKRQRRSTRFADVKALGSAEWRAGVDNSVVGKNDRNAETVSLSKSRAAVLRVRLTPWRPRPRRPDSAKIRENIDDILDFGDDLASLVISVGIWLTLIVMAPVITFVLAALLLPVEAGLLAIIGVVLLAVRFLGITRWTLAITEPDGCETVEVCRNIVRALGRVREINGSRRRAVKLVWA